MGRLSWGIGGRERGGSGGQGFLLENQYGVTGRISQDYIPCRY